MSVFVIAKVPPREVLPETESSWGYVEFVRVNGHTVVYSTSDVAQERLNSFNLAPLGFAVYELTRVGE